MEALRATAGSLAMGGTIALLLAVPHDAAAKGTAPGVETTPVYGGERRVELDGAEVRAARAIARAFEEEGAPAPTLDAGLATAARELAHTALARGLEAAAREEEVRLALARGGATVPSPIAVTARASDEAAARDRLRQRARESGRGSDRPDRFGVGVVGNGDELAAVLLLGRRRAILEPFPARVSIGSTHLLSGKVLPPLGSAEIHVTPPGGRPVRLPGAAPGAVFQVPIAFDAKGRWAVEVLGHGPRGPDVALLLEVWAGEPIPAEAPTAEAGAVEPEELREKAALVAREVNALRKARGLKPLAANPVLAKVARAYAAEMAATGRFAHRSERSGDPSDRVRAAGYRYRRIAENLAQAATALAAHRATVDSPGHLANLLDPSFSEAGFGLARAKNPDGSATLILVELFAQPAR